MKFICTQENLQYGLNTVSTIANKNTTLPILNNVLIEAKNGIITLSTTNLEIAIRCIVRGKVEEDGIITVNARLLTDYVNTLPKDKIDISTNNDVLKISCQQFATKINGLASDDFPLIPDVSREQAFNAKALDFKKALQSVIFSTAHDDSRPEISGVYFSIENNALTVVATDSFRLAEKRIPVEQTEGKESKIIVPAYTVGQLLRVLNDADDSQIVDVLMNDSQIMFNFENVHVISRLINGDYPDYQQIIPKEYKTTFLTNKGELTRVIKNVSLFCRLGINDIHFDFQPEKKQTAIRAANSELGENICILDGEANGDANNLVFNYKYILDGLNVIPGETISIDTIDANAAALITDAGDTTYRYIVMPIRQ